MSAQLFFSFQEPSDLEKKAHSIKITQEAHYCLMVALDAPRLNCFSSYWIFATNEFKEAAWSYRHWMIYSQARTSHFFEQELRQLQEAVEKYRNSCREASRFAQQAIACFQQAQKTQQGSLSALAKEIVTYRWKIAAYEATHAAIMQLNLAGARS